MSGLSAKREKRISNTSCIIIILYIVYTQLRTRFGNLNTIKRYRELCVLNVFLREHNILAESQMCFIIIIIIFFLYIHYVYQHSNRSIVSIPQHKHNYTRHIQSTCL